MTHTHIYMRSAGVVTGVFLLLVVSVNGSRCAVFPVSSHACPLQNKTNCFYGNVIGEQIMRTDSHNYTLAHVG